MTGPIADHDLIVGDDRYDIAGLTDGGSVELTITHRTRADDYRLNEDLV